MSSLREVKKEKVEEKEPLISDEERLGATQANLVCFTLSSGEKPITLMVQRQNEEDQYYRMGMNVKFKVLMMDYCQRKGLGFGTIRFLDPEGNGLKENQSPQDLDLEDGDVIDAFSEQFGG